MVNFESSVTLTVDLDQSSLSSARDEIEAELDDAASVGAMVDRSARADGGSRGDPSRQLETMIRLDSTRNSILQDILDELEGGAGDGDGGGFKLPGLGGLGGLLGGGLGGILAALGIGAAGVGAATQLEAPEIPQLEAPEIPPLEAPQILPEVPDVPDVGLPEIPPLEVPDIDPIPVDAPDGIPLIDPNGVVDAIETAITGPTASVTAGQEAAGRARDERFARDSDGGADPSGGGLPDIPPEAIIGGLGGLAGGAAIFEGVRRGALTVGRGGALGGRAAISRDQADRGLTNIAEATNPVRERLGFDAVDPSEVGVQDFTPVSSPGARRAAQARDERFSQQGASGRDLRVVPTVNNTIQIDPSGLDEIDRQIDRAIERAKQDLRRELESQLPTVP